MPAANTLGKRKLAALFTIVDIDENIKDLLDEKDGYHLHKAMIDYWLELRHQVLTTANLKTANLASTDLVPVTQPSCSVGQEP